MKIDSIIWYLAKLKADQWKGNQIYRKILTHIQESVVLYRTFRKFVVTEELEFFTPATLADITKSENAIGFPLPESYRQFATELSNGAILFGLQDVWPVGNGNSRMRPLQDILGYTALGQKLSWEDLEADIPFREGGTIKRNLLIPFSSDSNGNEWCFIAESLNADREYPVAYLHNHKPKLYGRLENFGIWLNINLLSRDEVIRAIYGCEVIDDELGLG